MYEFTRRGRSTFTMRTDTPSEGDPCDRQEVIDAAGYPLHNLSNWRHDLRKGQRDEIPIGLMVYEPPQKIPEPGNSLFRILRAQAGTLW